MTIPLPPAAPGQPRRGRHASRAPAVPLGLTRIMQSAELPAGVNAMASADGKMIVVRTGLEKAARRRAIREVLAASHRFPAIVLWPALADARIRRFAAGIGDAVASVVRHLEVLLSPAASPVAALVASTAVVVAAAGTAGLVTGVIKAPTFTNGGPAPQAQRPDPYAGVPHLPRVHATMPAVAASYLGVYEQGPAGSFAPFTRFGQTIGHMPNLALCYIGYGEAFNAAFAGAAAAHHAVPVIQMNPTYPTLDGIAAGTYNSYLIRYARAVHDYGGPVALSFGHEMNGNWYSWGWTHARPQAFVAAWRHIVTLFRMVGDYNVTWLWTINGISPRSSAAISDWWPGAGYVTWVGIDGYYNQATDTFASVFGQTLTAVHLIAPSVPILVTETAAQPPQSTEVAQIRGLFQGVRANQILGFIWYDEPGKGGRDWRLEDSPASVAAFRKAARGYG